MKKDQREAEARKCSNYPIPSNGMATTAPSTEGIKPYKGAKICKINKTTKTNSAIERCQQRQELHCRTSNIGAAVGLQSTWMETFPLSGCIKLGLPISAYIQTQQYSQTAQTHKQQTSITQNNKKKIQIIKYLHTSNHIRSAKPNPSWTISLSNHNYKKNKTLRPSHISVHFPAQPIKTKSTRVRVYLRNHSNFHIQRTVVESSATVCSKVLGYPALYE